jgi:hypothetical protein
MVSSILSRDIYQGWIRPETTDEGLLKVGRAFSVGIGLTVTALAVFFVNSQFGIFNLMQAFFTLLNIPVVVPIAFGLLFRKVPKWSAVGSIAWGLIVGITARYLLGWDIGPQVYLAFVMSFGIFASSPWTGQLYKTNKILLGLICVAIVLLTGWLFNTNIIGNPWQLTGEMQTFFANLGAALLGISLFGFAKLFAAETTEQRAMIEAFFQKLDTPVDVAREVFGAGKKQISTFPLVGGTTIVMGLLMSLIFFTGIPADEALILGVMIVIMVLFGSLMWYFGKKSEIKSAAQYEQRIHSDVQAQIEN